MVYLGTHGGRLLHHWPLHPANKPLQPTAFGG